MRNLKRLIISVSHEHDTIRADTFAGMDCPHLEMVMIHGSRWQWDVSFAQLFVSLGCTLKALCLWGMDMSDECVTSIMKLCPNLNILVWTGANASSLQSSAGICDFCIQLEHLDIFTPTDQCIERIARSLKLRTLSIADASNLTAASMVVISTHLRNTLASLTLLDARVSSSVLASLVDQLPHLRHFEFGGNSDVFPPTYLSNDFVSHLSNLTMLSVVSDKAPKQQVLVASIARHCTSLVHLRIDGSKQLTTALTGLVKKCKTLRSLHVQAVNLTKKEAWEKINPELLVVEAGEDTESGAFDSVFCKFSSFRHV